MQIMTLMKICEIMRKIVFVCLYTHPINKSGHNIVPIYIHLMKDVTAMQYYNRTNTRANTIGTVCYESLLFYVSVHQFLSDILCERPLFVILCACP